MLFAGLQSSGETVINRRAKARDHTERLLRHLGVAVDETETTVRMTPPDRLPAFDLTLPGDISTASLPIACVVASPLPRRLVIEDVGINETRTGFVRTLQAMGARHRDRAHRNARATSRSAGSSSSPVASFAASTSAALLSSRA